MTIVADETCLSDTVGGGNYSYYTLDIEQCTGSNFVNVLAWVTSDANAEWSLLVNTEGLVPEYDDDDLPSDGTSAIHIGKWNLHSYLSFLVEDQLLLDLSFADVRE